MTIHVTQMDIDVSKALNRDKIWSKRSPVGIAFCRTIRKRIHYSSLTDEMQKYIDLGNVFGYKPASFEAEIIVEVEHGNYR